MFQPAVSTYFVKSVVKKCTQTISKLHHHTQERHFRLGGHKAQSARECVLYTTQHNIDSYEQVIFMDSPSAKSVKPLFGARQSITPNAAYEQPLSTPCSPLSAPSTPRMLLPPIRGLFVCRIKSANGSQSSFSPYSVSCTARPDGVCTLQFDTSDGSDLTETRTFNLPPSRKVGCAIVGRKSKHTSNLGVSL